MYGSRLADLWRGTDLAAVKKAWESELGQLTRDQVLTGLTACKAKPWPPTLPEFLILCRPAPDYEGLFALAQQQISKREFGEDRWPCRALYWAAVEFGFADLRMMSFQAAKGRWCRVYDTKAAERELPAVPAAVPALPAPGKSVTGKDAARANLSDLLMALRGQRAGNRESSPYAHILNNEVPAWQ